jgi:hypothetical protein
MLFFESKPVDPELRDQSCRQHAAMDNFPSATFPYCLRSFVFVGAPGTASSRRNCGGRSGVELEEVEDEEEPMPLP